MFLPQPTTALPSRPALHDVLFLTSVFGLGDFYGWDIVVCVCELGAGVGTGRDGIMSR